VESENRRYPITEMITATLPVGALCITTLWLALSLGRLAALGASFSAPLSLSIALGIACYLSAPATLLFVLTYSSTRKTPWDHVYNLTVTCLFALPVGLVYALLSMASPFIVMLFNPLALMQHGLPTVSSDTMAVIFFSWIGLAFLPPALLAHTAQTLIQQEKKAAYSGRSRDATPIASVASSASSIYFLVSLSHATTGVGCMLGSLPIAVVLAMSIANLEKYFEAKKLKRSQRVLWLTMLSAACFAATILAFILLPLQFAC